MNVYEEILGRDGKAAESIAILGKECLTFSDVLSRVDKIAAALRDAGVGRGQRIGICLDQGTEYLASILSVYKIGAVAVLLTPDWTAREQQRVIQSASLTAVLADMPAVGGMTETPGTPIDGLGVYIQTFEPTDVATSEPNDAVIIYTSGTTSVPKGVVLSADAVSANVRAVASYLEITDRDRCPIFTPPCYAYSLSQNLVNAVQGCASLPVPSGLRYPAEIIANIETHGLTGISGTPTAMRLFCDTTNLQATDLASVRFVMVGGQFLDLGLVERIERNFPNARVVNMYGASENCPRISYHYVDKRMGLDDAGYFAVGTAVEGTEIEIADPDGVRVATGEIGEIVIRGTSLMRTYWNNEADTLARLRDGWFHTRDLGYFDADGLLHISGRDSNVINVGNDKVIPEEVEKVLTQIPGIDDAAVFGCPDPLTGESVHAIVVCDGADGPESSDWRRQCRRLLSGYKIPKTFHVAAEIPRTLYGKIDRKALKSSG